MTPAEQRVIEVARKIDAGVPAYHELEEAFESLDAEPKFKVGDWVRSGPIYNGMMGDFSHIVQQWYEGLDVACWEPWQPRAGDPVVCDFDLCSHEPFTVVQFSEHSGAVDDKGCGHSLSTLRPASPAEGGKEGDASGRPDNIRWRSDTTSAVPGEHRAGQVTSAGNAANQNTPPVLEGKHWNISYGYPDPPQRFADVQRDMDLAKIALDLIAFICNKDEEAYARLHELFVKQEGERMARLESNRG